MTDEQRATYLDDYRARIGRDLQPGAARGPRNSCVDIAPFADWIAWAIRSRFDGVISDFARCIGRDMNQVRRWLARETPSVTLATVDAVFVAYGDPGLLYRLYPLIDERTAA
jgi:hypothetical protein